MGLFSFIRNLNDTLCNVISIIPQKTKQFNEETTVRCAESELDCKRRVKKVLETMEEEKLTNFNIQEAYDSVMRGKGKNPLEKSKPED